MNPSLNFSLNLKEFKNKIPPTLKTFVSTKPSLNKNEKRKKRKKKNVYGIPEQRAFVFQFNNEKESYPRENSPPKKESCQEKISNLKLVKRGSQIVINRPRPRSSRNSMAFRSLNFNNQNEIELAKKRTISTNKFTSSSIRGVKLGKKKSEFKGSKLLIYSGWTICFILFIRLIFSQGGIQDFQTMERVLNEKKLELSKIEDENNILLTEIHKIKTNKTHQKFLIRKHLGLMAPDEFLILFEK